MSDDDSDSDIECMFKKVESERKKRMQQDSEEEDSDEDEVVVSWGNKKQRNASVEEKLALIEQKKAIRQRKRTCAMKEKDSDDEDNDEVQVMGSTNKNNAVKIQVEVRTAGTENKKHNMALLDDSSDDDEEEEEAAACSAATRNGAINPELEKVRQAAAELQSAQRYHADEVRLQSDALNLVALASANGATSLPVAALASGMLPPSVVGLQNPNAALLSTMTGLPPHLAGLENLNATSLTGLAGAHQGISRSISLNVNAQLVKHGSSDAVAKKTVPISIRENDPLQGLQNVLLQQLGLSETSAVVTMTFNGQALYVSKTPSSYGLQDRATIDATVRLTGFDAFSSNTTTEPKTDLGKAMRVTLRCLDGKSVIEDNFKIRSKETLQSLADQYRQSRKLAKSKRITLKFDGEKLNLSKTPASYDMEDEDLIDVEVK